MKQSLVIIIGCGNSFGLSISETFNRQGYDIVLMGYNMRKLNEQIKTLTANNITAYPVNIDVTDINSISKAFEEIKKLKKPIELMIYNAVARRDQKPSELTANELMEDFKVSMSGAISCTNELLPVFQKQNFGAIIYTGGGVAISPSLKHASMSICKAGLRNYAINLSNELKDSNIFIGTLTITQPVQENTEYSPQIIAKRYFKIFSEKQECEIII